MTGVLQVLLGSVGFVAQSGVTNRSDTSASAINPQVRFQTDGNVLKRNSANGLDVGNPWGTPAGTGNGALFWINVTHTSGNSFTGSDSTGAWLQLNVERVWGITAPLVGNSASAAGSYQIASDSGGSNVVGGGTFSLDDDR